MTAVYVVAGAVGQPLLSRVVDRVGRTGVLLASGILSSLAFVAVAVFAVSVPAIAAVGAALAGFFAPPLEPSLRSLWPSIVPAGKPLRAAFSLDAGAQEVMFILGPLLTVIGIAAFGATGNVVFAAVIGLVGTVAFAANPVSRSFERPHALAARPLSPIRIPAFRRIVVFGFGVGLPIGVLTITATAFAEAEGIEGLAGWALAGNALGALLGATVLALRPLSIAPSRVIALCGALLAVAYLPLALDLPWPVWMGAAVVAGVMLPPTLAQVFERVSEVAAESGLNEANAWIVSALNIGIAAGTVGAGAVIGSGLVVAVVIASAVTLLLSLLVLPARRKVAV
jgi:predicted MFS family arabinose efflux permease